MSKDEITQESIILTCFHCHGNYIDDFAGIRRKQHTTYYFSRILINDSFQQTVRLSQCLCSRYRHNRQFLDNHIQILLTSLILIQSDTRHWRINKYGVSNRITVTCFPLLISKQIHTAFLAIFHPGLRY